MQRTSPALRPPERTDVPAPAAPVELPSLHEALERARAADVSRAEVDALLRVLALPPPAGEAARERAKVLHGIMEDTWVGGRVGSDGHRVAHAAAEALIELGYPHALEVPPELLAEAREARRRPGSKPRAHWGPEDWARRQRTGARLVVAAGLLECTGLTVYQAMGWLEGTVDAPWGAVMGFLLLSGGVPALTLAAATGPVRRSRWLHQLLGAWATLPGIAWLVPSPLVLILAIFSPEVLVYYLPFATLGVMRISGANRLYEVPSSEP
jgi:hypothetical protein